uniref:Dr1-associated corepressor n=1 Tax=Ornithorhynchus anatinus TaxID=9258 RepID=A0A6I8NJT5_ORNAN
MPSKKKKYNARFPPARIKKIMQTDEEIGKVAAAVPVIISRALELFLESLLKKACQVTQARNAKTMTTSHLKQCIELEQQFDFLKDLVASVPDMQGDGEDNHVDGDKGTRRGRKSGSGRKNGGAGGKGKDKKQSGTDSEQEVRRAFPETRRAAHPPPRRGSHGGSGEVSGPGRGFPLLRLPGLTRRPAVPSPPTRLDPSRTTRRARRRTGRRRRRRYRPRPADPPRPGSRGSSGPSRGAEGALTRGRWRGEGLPGGVSFLAQSLLGKKGFKGSGGPLGAGRARGGPGTSREGSRGGAGGRPGPAGPSVWSWAGDGGERRASPRPPEGRGPVLERSHGRRGGGRFPSAMLTPLFPFSPSPPRLPAPRPLSCLSPQPCPCPRRPPLPPLLTKKKIMTHSPPPPSPAPPFSWF